MCFTRGCSSRACDAKSSDRHLRDDDGGVGLAADGVDRGDGEVVGAFGGIRQTLALESRVGFHRPRTVVPCVQGASAWGR